MADRDLKPENVCHVEDVMRGGPGGPISIVCGAPSVHPSGLCERHLERARERHEHALEKHRVRTGPTAVRSVRLDLD